MSWTETEQRIILMRYDCDYCPAKREEWCMTKSGNRATHLHGSRGEELTRYTWDVFEEGEKAGKSYAERKAQFVIDDMQRQINQLKHERASLSNLQGMWVGGA